MAATTTSYLMIVMNEYNPDDALGYPQETTYKIDNPQDNLSLSTVQTTFASQFNSDTAVIVGYHGYALQSVKEAYYEVTTRTSLD